MPFIWEFDKFWVIWISCLDHSRTLKQIQQLWDYKGNALYQKGEKLPIWKEMLAANILEEKGEIKKRGVKGKLLYGKFEWVKEYLDRMFKSFKYDNNNSLPLEFYECFPSKEGLINFFDKNREIFFSIKNLKILFGNKEALKNYGNLSIFCPIVSILLLSLISFLSKEGAPKEVISLLLHPAIFQPNFSLNFIAYFKEIMKSLKPEAIPKGLVSREALFKILKKYAES